MPKIIINLNTLRIEYTTTKIKQKITIFGLVKTIMFRVFDVKPKIKTADESQP